MERSDIFQGCSTHKQLWRRSNVSAFTPNCQYCLTSAISSLIEYVDALETRVHRVENNLVVE